MDGFLNINTWSGIVMFYFIIWLLAILFFALSKKWVKIKYYLYMARKHGITAGAGNMLIDNIGNEIDIYFIEFLFSIIFFLTLRIILSIFSLSYVISLCIILFVVNGVYVRNAMAKFQGMAYRNYIPKFNVRLKIDAPDWMIGDILLNVLLSKRPGYYVWSFRGWNGRIDILIKAIIVIPCALHLTGVI